MIYYLFPMIYYLFPMSYYLFPMIYYLFPMIYYLLFYVGNPNAHAQIMKIIMTAQFEVVID